MTRLSAIELQELLKRCFSLPIFDDPRKRREILGPMPNQEKWDNEKRKIASARTGDLGIMRPCYEGPLLTREQEYHLFRQYNYWKHKAIKRLSHSHLKDATAHYRCAQCVRNTIVESNTRLAVSILRKNPHNEEVMADAYETIIKAVDYFDYRRGIKFSTYCTWAINRGVWKFHHESTKHVDKYDSDEHAIDHVEARDTGIAQEAEYKNLQKVVKQLIGKVNKREASLLAMRFGIGCEPMTLKAVGNEMSISKERVRQIQLVAFEKIRAYIGANPERDWAAIKNVVSI